MRSATHLLAGVSLLLAGCGKCCDTSSSPTSASAESADTSCCEAPCAAERAVEKVERSIDLDHDGRIGGNQLPGNRFGRRNGAPATAQEKNCRKCTNDPHGVDLSPKK